MSNQVRNGGVRKPRVRVFTFSNLTEQQTRQLLANPTLLGCIVSSSAMARVVESYLGNPNEGYSTSSTPRRLEVEDVRGEVSHVTCVDGHGDGTLSEVGGTETERQPRPQPCSQLEDAFLSLSLDRKPQ
ncbi:hypothetical protein CYMTET_47252 [Cymbomonas tetramitiformis]|uniref:Uncharacterized protein n=1 Tax=Cymbomonas tetramitiformis TaxID=36881 RepID=A0AAE0BWK0_9CHLO|nr:hypothetical protein CYMTET_47252 [Cymbomonas tetramitiformis]